MKIKNYTLLFFVLTILSTIISCSSDDDDEDFVLVEARDRAEQQIADKDSILAYLTTHYYNSSFFESGSNHKYNDIIITELPKDDEGNYLELPDPANNTLLIEAVETRFTNYLDTDYEYYVLVLNQGGGDSPKYTDEVRVRAEGVSINTGDVFESIITPSVVPLQGGPQLSNGEYDRSIESWRLILPTFNGASNFNISNTGDLNFNDFGLGVMFIPSGLGYFSRSATGSSYDNLIFKFELLQSETIDHDLDGLPTYVEDIDSNFQVEDDDTDGDEAPNFFDQDDDGDDVATINELIPTEYIVDTTIGEEEPLLNTNEYEVSRSESNGIITINTVTIADSNNDGLPDYLDAAITTNYNEESN